MELASVKLESISQDSLVLSSNLSSHNQGSQSGPRDRTQLLHNQLLRPPQFPRRPSHDLFECIEQTPGKRLTEEQASYVFTQIAEAVYYLDSQGITHRDIKDENLLIDTELKVKRTPVMVNRLINLYLRSSSLILEVLSSPIPTNRVLTTPSFSVPSRMHPPKSL